MEEEDDDSINSDDTFIPPSISSMEDERSKKLMIENY